jgi:hypothetical protein
VTGADKHPAPNHDRSSSPVTFRHEGVTVQAPTRSPPQGVTLDVTLEQDAPPPPPLPPDPVPPDPILPPVPPEPVAPPRPGVPPVTVAPPEPASGCVPPVVLPPAPPVPLVPCPPVPTVTLPVPTVTPPVPLDVDGTVVPLVPPSPAASTTGVAHTQAEYVPADVQACAPCCPVGHAHAALAPGTHVESGFPLPHPPSSTRERPMTTTHALVIMCSIVTPFPLPSNSASPVGAGRTNEQIGAASSSRSKALESPSRGPAVRLNGAALPGGALGGFQILSGYEDADI